MKATIVATKEELNQCGIHEDINREVEVIMNDGTFVRTLTQDRGLLLEYYIPTRFLKINSVEDKIRDIVFAGRDAETGEFTISPEETLNKVIQILEG
jgi:hypothetical protein